MGDDAGCHGREGGRELNAGRSDDFAIVHGSSYLATAWSWRGVSVEFLG